MATGAKRKAREAAANAEVVSVTLPEGMPPEIAAVLLALAPSGAAPADASATVPEALASFEPGDHLSAYAEERLRSDCPAYDDAISALAAALDDLAACSAEVRRLREMMGRAQDVEYGRSSETLSSLGLDPMPDADAPDDILDGFLDEILAGGDASDGSDATGTADDEGDGNASGATDDKGDADGPDTTGDKGEKGQKEKGQWPHGREREGKPRRTDGCADHVARDAIRIRLLKTVDESVLELLRGQGHRLKRMSPTAYRVLHRFDVTFLLEVSSERFRVLDTGEYVHADTAAESKPMANSPLGADVIAGILYDRYVLAMTAPKIATEALTAGLGITRQTIYRVCTQFAASLALPLVRHLLWHIVRSKCAQSDETWIKVRQELAEWGRKNSVMWLVRTGEKLGIPPAVVLAHTGTRSAAALADLLRDFSGKLMCDGYTAYPAALEMLAEAVRKADGRQTERLIVLCGCLQHVRAKFADAIQALHKWPEWKAMSPAERAKLPAARVIAAISAVFKADRDMPEGGREERAEFRRTRVRPLLDKAFRHIDHYLATPLGAMDDYLGEALRYADAQREKLYEAVDDPDVALHNTACEREFAFFGTIRNACRQIDSTMGAWTLAMWFSIVRTAHANKADERIYLQFILEEGPKLLMEHDDWHWQEVPDGGWQSYDPGPLRTEDERPYLEVLMSWDKRYLEYARGFRERRRDEFMHYASLIERAGPVATGIREPDQPPEATERCGPKPTAREQKTLEPAA